MSGSLTSTLPRMLTRLDRLASSVPLSASAGVHRVVGSAVGNARRSLDEIERLVDERRLLRHRLDSASEPGDLAALSAEECLALLASRSIGRLAYCARPGAPDIVPVNYVLEEGVILLRSGPGPKLQAAERKERVAFEVDDIDEQTHSGWSVVVLGLVERLAPQDLGLHAATPWAGGPRQHRIQIVPRRLTGRRLL